MKQKKKEVTVEELAAFLEGKGLSAKDLEHMFRGRSKAEVTYLETKSKGRYIFGMVSDTHLASKGCALAELVDFYKKCRALGVKEIFHSGDFMDGMNVYSGQNNELVCWGVNDHLKFGVENYPHVEGITTYCISGNHDEAYIKSFGIDVLEAIAHKRPDIKYLGVYNGQIKMSNGLLIELQHGAKGVPYAISYHLQKYIANLPAGNKPNLYQLGHYHAVLFMTYRNISAFLPGSWQRGNAFTTRLGLHTVLGGWIVEVELADDKRSSIKRIKTEFIPYY